MAFASETAHERLELPDLAALGIRWPRLQKSIDEYREAQAHVRSASAAEEALVAQREEAQRQDREVYGQALRERKADPGQVHGKALEQMITAARREREGWEAARARIAAEVVTAVDADRARRRADVTAEIVQHQAARDEALRTALVHITAIGRLGSLALWLNSFPGDVRLRPTVGRRVPGMVQLNGEPYREGEVVEALLAPDSGNGAKRPVITG